MQGLLNTSPEGKSLDGTQFNTIECGPAYSGLYIKCPVHNSSYRVILRIVKAGGHPVAIAQVVEH